MVNYTLLGRIVEARQNFTEEELIEKVLNNVKPTHIRTVLPLEDIEVNAKNVQEMSEKLTIRTL
jgi:hypothetical protein